MPWLAARRPGCDPCRAAPGDQTAPGSSGDWFSGGRRRQRARCARRRRAGGRRAPLRGAVPTRGRHARERETSADDGAPYRREWRTPCSIGTALFAALRAAVPTRGRRSLAGASLRVVAWAPVGGAGRRRRSARAVRRAAQRRTATRENRGDGQGTPTSGRHARERETSADDGAPYRREWRTPCSIRTALFAALRAAVPTRGRRSLAGASLVLNRDCAVRCASRSGADQRSAFPCRRVACAQPGLRCSLRFAQRCRPEVGVPLPARRLCSIRTAPLAPRRGAVPTGGRRSLACASLVLNRDCAARPAARGGADQRSAFPCLCVACAQSGLRRSPRGAGRCRPEVGVPVPVRRLCSIRTAPLAPRRGAVPTGGRRSRACASLRLVAWAPCVGVPLLARRSAW